MKRKTNTTISNKKSTNPDARFFTAEEQTMQRVSTLYDVMNECQLKSLENFKSLKHPKGLIPKIAKRHQITSYKLYRWIREYVTEGGIHIITRGRIAA